MAQARAGVRHASNLSCLCSPHLRGARPSLRLLASGCSASTHARPRGHAHHPAPPRLPRGRGRGRGRESCAPIARQRLRLAGHWCWHAPLAPPLLLVLLLGAVGGAIVGLVLHHAHSHPEPAWGTDLLHLRSGRWGAELRWAPAWQWRVRGGRWAGGRRALLHAPLVSPPPARACPGPPPLFHPHPLSPHCLAAHVRTRVRTRERACKRTRVQGHRPDARTAPSALWRGGCSTPANAVLYRVNVFCVCSVPRALTPEG